MDSYDSAWLASAGKAAVALRTSALLRALCAIVQSCETDGSVIKL
jgi:hypothetical protein